MDSERIGDTIARLGYRRPAGWRTGSEELISPFTLAITDDAGSVVVSGRWKQLLTEPPSADELIAGAAWLASEYGEVWASPDGDRTEVVMENTTVAGRPAARAGYLLVFAPDGGETTYVRVLVIALERDCVSFVLGVAPDSQRHVIDGVLASTQVLP